MIYKIIILMKLSIIPVSSVLTVHNFHIKITFIVSGG